MIDKSFFKFHPSSLQPYQRKILEAFRSKSRIISMPKQFGKSLIIKMLADKHGRFILTLGDVIEFQGKDQTYVDRIDRVSQYRDRGGISRYTYMTELYPEMLGEPTAEITQDRIVQVVKSCDGPAPVFREPKFKADQVIKHKDGDEIKEGLIDTIEIIAGGNANCESIFYYLKDDNLTYVEESDVINQGETDGEVN